MLLDIVVLSLLVLLQIFLIVALAVAIINFDIAAVGCVVDVSCCCFRRCC